MIGFLKIRRTYNSLQTVFTILQFWYHWTVQEYQATIWHWKFTICTHSLQNSEIKLTSETNMSCFHFNTDYNVVVKLMHWIVCNSWMSIDHPYFQQWTDSLPTISASYKMISRSQNIANSHIQANNCFYSMLVVGREMRRGKKESWKNLGFVVEDIFFNRLNITVKTKLIK